MDIIENDIFQFDKKPHSDDILQIALRNFKNTISPIIINNNDKKSPTTPLTRQLREIDLNEVSNHDSINDCWIVLYDRVYDVTKFLDTHPGGHDVILENAGRDATIPFRGTGHSAMAIKLLNNYLIGELPSNERLFRKSSSTDQNNCITIILSDIPE